MAKTIDVSDYKEASTWSKTFVGIMVGVTTLIGFSFLLGMNVSANNQQHAKITDEQKVQCVMIERLDKRLSAEIARSLAIDNDMRETLFSIQADIKVQTTIDAQTSETLKKIEQKLNI